MFRFAWVLAMLLLVSLTLAWMILVTLLALAFVVTLAIFMWCLCKCFPAFSCYTPSFVQLAVRTVSTLAMMHAQALCAQVSIPTHTCTASTNTDPTERDQCTTSTNTDPTQRNQCTASTNTDSTQGDQCTASTNTDPTERDPCTLPHLASSNTQTFLDTLPTTDGRDFDLGDERVAAGHALANPQPRCSVMEDMTNLDTNSSPDRSVSVDPASDHDDRSPDECEPPDSGSDHDFPSVNSSGYGSLPRDACDTSLPLDPGPADDNSLEQDDDEQDSGEGEAAVGDPPSLAENQRRQEVFPIFPCEEENPNPSSIVVVQGYSGAKYATISQDILVHPEQDTGGGGTWSAQRSSWMERKQSQPESWVTPPHEENDNNPGASSMLVLPAATGVVCSTGRHYSLVQLEEPKATITNL